MSSTTDLSIRGLLRGRLTPGRIVFDRARIYFRIADDGEILTHLPLKQSQGATPEIVVHDGELSMAQEGRPEMVVHRLEGKISPSPQGPPFVVEGRRSRLGTSSTSRAGSRPDFSGVPVPADGRPTGGGPGEGPARSRSSRRRSGTMSSREGPIGVVLDYTYTAAAMTGAGPRPARAIW